MPDTARLHRLCAGVEADLIGGILPYWMTKALDERFGGFAGQITHTGRVVDRAPKAAVLNTRILWTFAVAGRVLEEDRYRAIAQRAFAYLADHYRDAEHDGVYWMLDYAGRPLRAKKQVYAQAFAIYGLAEYYRLTGEAASLAWAVDLFQAVERHGFDPEHGGYFEAFSRDWKPLDDVRLSDRDAHEKKSMNTHLHLLEAYTTLFRVWPDAALKRQLQHLLDLFLTTILDDETGHLQLFFDESWTPKSRVVSFGHDIEASWLLVEAAAVLREPARSEATRQKALKMAQATYDEGLDADGALCNEAGPGGHLDADRYWWPQAEAVIGFLNAYQLSADSAYLDAALASWAYIDRHLIDRAHGEWFARVAKDGTLYREEDKVGPWKGPYHNARMAFEVMERVAGLGKEEQ